jgi:hypothetical protein
MRVDSNKTGRNVKGSNCVLLLPIPVRLLVPPTLERSAITRNGFIGCQGADKHTPDSSSTLLLLSLWMLIVWWTLLDQS